MTERTIAGKYSLKRELGRGGMGVVWEAFDQVLQRRVALKLIISSNAISDIDRLKLEHEAKAIAKLQNNHVVQVYDFGVEDGSPYLVMEYLEGETLADRLLREGRLPLSAVQGLLQQLAMGLEAANSVGIVHQDLKPANIFLTSPRSGAAECAKILDFGLVWRPDSGNGQRSQALMGTPTYMSPEQINRDPVDHSSDLWGLTVILYRALTGMLPFSGEGGMWSLLAAICLDPHPAPSALNPDLPPGLDTFFQCALAKERAQRYPNLRALCAAFATHSNTSRAPVKILAVDDEPDVEKMLRLQFRRQIRSSKYEFFFAQDGAKALEVLQQNPDIDVVLSDINMPVMNGLALLERISELTTDARVVMVSAFGDMANIRTAMNRGAFDFILKPIDFEDLAATIEKTSKHINEIRKGAKATKEYDLIKSFTNPTLLEHIRTLGPASAHAAESNKAAVVVAKVCQGQPPHPANRPSDAARWLNANFETITATLVRHHGSIEKFVNSLVVSVFQGEGCANQAAAAALAIRAQLALLARETGVDSPYASGVGIGIAEGDVFMGSLGSPGHGRFDYGPFGPTIEMAMHFAHRAAPGEILIHETACLNIDPKFAYEICDSVEPSTTMTTTAFRLLEDKSVEPVTGTTKLDLATI